MQRRIKMPNINPKQSIVFTPVYNIEPDKDVLEMDMNGYQILTKDRFFELYRDNADLFQRNGIKFINAESDANPKYFLVFAGLDAVLTKHNLTPIDLSNIFKMTLLYARLHQPGNIQIGSIFISNKDGTVNRQTIRFDDFCVFQGLKMENNQFVSDPYVLTKDTVNKIVNRANRFEAKLENCVPEIINTAWFFMRACETSDVAYKIINYFTVLEKLMSDDGDSGDIKFKLGARLSFLMGENLRAFIGKGYNVRSHILHRGDIFQKKRLQDLIELCSELDRICRFVINYFVDKFIDEGKVKIKESYKELDDDMFAVLALAQSLKYI